MSATVATRTHGTCAGAGCDKSRRGAIAFGWRWVAINGQVYSSERRTFVVHSWAESCPTHAAAVSVGVREDIEEWAERWRIIRHTLDYTTNESLPEQIDAEGTGTPNWMLF